jgi:hypothetical protein
MFLYDLLKDPVVRIPEDQVDLPDFVRPDYPFDLPSYRRAFFTRVFEAAGVPLICPNPQCRRSRRCAGEDGPDCYRADRERLSRLLMRVYVACNMLNPEGIAEVAMALDSELGGPPLNMDPSFVAPLTPPPAALPPAREERVPSPPEAQGRRGGAARRRRARKRAAPSACAQPAGDRAP